MLDQYGEHIETLYETGSRPLTAVGGTANVVTATMAIDVTAAGLLDGLCVSITWVAANTAGVTLSINTGSAIPVVDARGLALVAGTLSNGLTSVLRYTAGQWRIISGFGADTATGGPTDQTFTATSTWTKPTNYDDDTIVLVELWGGGGAGGRGLSANANGAGGGGGGGYARGEFRIGDLPGSVSVSIGAGGVEPSGNGGNSTFGTFLTAYGGGGGSSLSGTDARGGGGGGAGSAGAQATSTIAGAGGAIGGASGTSGAVTTPGGAGDAIGIYGGGGGLRSVTAVTGRINGRAYYGGGGGGATGSNAIVQGGSSVFGGRGGDGTGAGIAGENGVAPGGGGAGTQGAVAAGNGARGQCRVRILG
jgi:hypothetical protein